MTYAIHHHEDTQVIQVHNLLNELENLSILKEIKKRFQDNRSAFIIDLSELEFMNSVGLNFLIALLTDAKKNNNYMAIANANDQVVKLLKTTKLLPIFNLTTSVEEALQEIENKSNSQ